MYRVKCMIGDYCLAHFALGNKTPVTQRWSLPTFETKLREDMGNFKVSKPVVEVIQQIFIFRGETHRLVVVLLSSNLGKHRRV